MLSTNFQRQIDFKWSQGDQDALENPQRPHQAQQWGVQQVNTSYVHQKSTWHIFIY